MVTEESSVLLPARIVTTWTVGLSMKKKMNSGQVYHIYTYTPFIGLMTVLLHSVMFS